MAPTLKGMDNFILKCLIKKLLRVGSINKAHIKNRIPDKKIFSNKRFMENNVKKIIKIYWITNIKVISLCSFFDCLAIFKYIVMGIPGFEPGSSGPKPERLPGYPISPVNKS